MTIKWQDGDTEIVIYDDRLVEAIETNGEKAMKEAVKFVRNESVKLINTSPATGRIYFKRRGRPGKRGKVSEGWGALGSYIMHQASAPDEPPATDTGGLIRTINFKTGKDKEGIFGDVGTNIAYGKALEFGYAPHNLAARPYLRPAINNNQKKIMTLMIKNLLPGGEE